jgi:hypothetical protein
MPASTPPPGRRRLLLRRPRLSIPVVLYAHSFELAVAVLLGVSAIRTATRLEAVLGILNAPTVYAWATLTALGILGIVVGLFGAATPAHANRPKLRAFYRASEKAGLYLLAAGTLVIAVLVEFALPFADAWPSDVQLGALAAACLLRAGAIRKAEAITLDVLRHARQTREEDSDE